MTISNIQKSDTPSTDGVNGGALVSVVIPTYNREKLVAKAISTVQLQDYKNLEILVVDDGSTDNTIAVVEKMAAQDARIRLLVHEKNKGEAGARNTGLSSANGTYLAFLDSDDEWIAGQLASQLEVLQNCGHEVAAVIGQVLQIDASGQESVLRDWTDRKPISDLNLLTLGGGVNMGNTLLVHTSIAREIGAFDEELPIFVDLDWLCRLTKRYNVKKVARPVARYNKAPMRSGAFLELGVKMFYKKNRAYLESFSWRQRMKIRSQFYNYVSLAYAVNGPKHRFIVSRALHLICNPLQHPGSYFHFITHLFNVSQNKK